VHPTLGILARFQAFFYASAFFQSDGVPPPAPARVTQTVSPQNSLPFFFEQKVYPLLRTTMLRMDNHYRIINEHYQNSKGDSTELFQVILSVADKIGMDKALAYLEQCVIAKRVAWLDKNLDKFEKTDDPVFDAYRLFYEVYLRVSTPTDGEIVERSERKLVTRWWNHCPTLDACVKLGLDTRELCRKVYHQPVQEFLSQLNPQLRFERNYERLRPHTGYCEEIITLEE